MKDSYLKHDPHLVSCNVFNSINSGFNITVSLCSWSSHSFATFSCTVFCMNMTVLVPVWFLNINIWLNTTKIYPNKDEWRSLTTLANTRRRKIHRGRYIVTGCTELCSVSSLKIETEWKPLCERRRNHKLFSSSSRWKTALYQILFGQVIPMNLRSNTNVSNVCGRTAQYIFLSPIHYWQLVWEPTVAVSINNYFLKI